jgi:hypothetical protein
VIIENLFNLDEFTLWKQEWKDMPEFEQNNLSPFTTIEILFSYPREDGFPETKLKPYRIIKVHFRNNEDLIEFGNLLNIKGLNKEIKQFCYCESIEKFSILLNQKITEATISL